MPVFPPPQPNHDQTIPFVTLANWVRAAALCNINIEAVFREVGLSAEKLHPENSMVSVDALRRVMAICCVEARTRGIQHFPFALGETFAFEHLADLEIFLTTSPTLRAAMPLLDWVRIFINPMMRQWVVEEPGMSRLVVELSHAEEAPEVSQAFAEAIFASILKFGRLLMGERPPFLKLSLRFPAPAHAALCEPYYQMPVEYGASENALLFETKLLDMPLRGAFPSLHQQAEQRVQQRLAQLPKNTELVAAIEKAFIDHPALFGQSVDAMALRLQLHPRTLQRRLRDEGQSFSSVLAQVRFRLASQWLRESPAPIEDIAERLGFADRRSFTQAFSRWAGCTPSQYRQGAR